MQSRRRSASYADRQWLQRSAYDNRKEIFSACQSLSCCFKRRSLTDDSASCRCWNPTDSLVIPTAAKSLAKEQVGCSSPHACAIKKSLGAANTAAHHCGGDSPAAWPKSLPRGRAGSLSMVALAAPLAMTRFFLGGASALAESAAGLTFGTFGAAVSAGSGVSSGAGAGVAATGASAGSGVLSDAGAGVAATAASAGSGVSSGAGAGVAATASTAASGVMSGAGRVERTCIGLEREGFGRSDSLMLNGN